MSGWISGFLRILIFALVIAAWSRLNRSRFEAAVSMIIIIAGVLMVFPITWAGRRALDAKPTPDDASRIATLVHYGLLLPFGAAIFEAIKVGGAWRGWTIPLPRMIGWMLMIVTGAVVMLTVLNLAFGGLGAPFAVALSRRLAVRWMYAWTRNPMVLSMIAFLLSFGFWQQSTLFILWMLALVIPAWLYFLKTFEERELEIRFGTPYLEYKARTPRLWPRRPVKKIL